MVFCMTALILICFTVIGQNPSHSPTKEKRHALKLSIRLSASSLAGILAGARLHTA
jgi:hypothetical protein